MAKHPRAARRERRGHGVCRVSSHTVCGELVLDGYRFSLAQLKGLGGRSRSSILLEAPQGLVRLLPRLAEAVAECTGLPVYVRLEPSYGLCSLSLDVASRLNALLVHVGHTFYPYPFCSGQGCVYGVPSNVVLLPAEYTGGDARQLADSIKDLGLGRVVLGFTAQHKGLVHELRNELGSRGVTVVGVEPVLGCYFENLRRYRGRVDGFLVVAGGLFHGLGIGLAFSGEERVIVADPYTGRVRDIGDAIRSTLMKRFWAMKQFMDARSIGIIVGGLPGQLRPGLVSALEKLALKRGLRVALLYAERLTREYLDNLDPGIFDAYVVTSCPRLAVEDLGDYWKPVLSPGEARIVLLHGKPGT